MLILNIETSTNVCSASLSCKEKIIGEKVSYENNSHSKLLADFIDKLFKESDFSPQQLDAVSVSQGPGSYTGLRIGVSTAKGLSYALNKPLIAIDTLKIMSVVALKKAKELKIEDAILCPMIDARRMEVYSAFFDFDLVKTTETNNIIIDENSFLTSLQNKNVVFFGNGAEKCKNIITHSNSIYLDDIYPLSSAMVNLSMKKYEQKDFVDLAYFEPFYLKPFIATTPKNKLF